MNALVKIHTASPGPTSPGLASTDELPRNCEMFTVDMFAAAILNHELLRAKVLLWVRSKKGSLINYLGSFYGHKLVFGIVGVMNYT